MFPKLAKKNVNSLCLTTLMSIFALLTLIGCENPPQNRGVNNNSNINTNSNKNSNTNSNDQASSDIKEYERGIEAYKHSIPPTTEGISSGSTFLKVDDVKDKLGVVSLKDVAIVLTPLKYPVNVESVEFTISSGDKTIFSIPTSTTRSSRTFPPLERPSKNIVGYPFELNPQRVAEGDRYFVSGNTIRVIPQIKRENGAEATFYLVNKNSEVERKQAK